MRAWKLETTTAGPRLITADVPQPAPGPGELLIRVHAAGVTPTELTWYPTTHTKAGQPRNHAIPGHEFSGTIAALGTGTTGVEIGQDIYGMNDWFTEGATAEYCLTRPEWIAPKPSRLTHAEAATVPIGALTAWQGLFDRANLQPNERILIHGGSGAVGAFAVQLARWKGAHVITTASARNREFLLQLGAEQVIDYHTERFDEIVKNIDVVFDTVGGETLKRSWSVLSPRGRLVAVAAESEETKDERAKTAFFIVEPKGDQLSRIAQILESGEIKPVVDAVVPFVEAGAAYAGQVGERAGRGKVVVSLEQ
jgi:NADPH:quinone reductase-like Zn-dependent oxidoreductase